MRRAQRVVTTRLAITLSYAAVDAARRLFERFDASVREDTFGNDVRLVVDLPAEHVDALSSALGDVTSGKCVHQLYVGNSSVRMRSVPFFLCYS